MKTTPRKGRTKRDSARKHRVQEERERQNKRIDIAAQRAVEARLLPGKGAFHRYPKLSGFLLSLFVTLFLFYFDSFDSVWPRVSIETLDVTDPADPLSVPFEIKNENFFWHNDVQYICVQINATSAGLIKTTVQGNRYFPSDRWIGTLGRGDVATRSCRVLDMIVESPFPIKTAEFMVAVAFRPWFFPDVKRTRFIERARFVIEYDRNGRGHIFRQPKVPLPPTQPLPPLPSPAAMAPDLEDLDVFD